MADGLQKTCKIQESVKEGQMELVALSEVDYKCPICMYLLIEPVTLPCKHSFCLKCYRQTVEISNLTCPICRMRISVWARKASKSNTLIDKVKWQAIKEAFPVKVQYRLEGKDYDDGDENVFQEDHETQLRKLKELSRPGEIRQEYEAALERLQHQREEEAKREEEASAALIRALQQEAEEEMAEQLRLKAEQEKLDKEAAQSLEKVDIRLSVESRELQSPVTTKKFKKGSKNGKKTQQVIKRGNFLTLNTFFNTVPHSALLSDSLSSKQGTKSMNSSCDCLKGLVDVSYTGELLKNQYDSGPSGQQHHRKFSEVDGKKENYQTLMESCEQVVKTRDISDFDVYCQPGMSFNGVPSQGLGHSVASDGAQAEFSSLASQTADQSDNLPVESRQKGRIVSSNETIHHHGLCTCIHDDGVDDITSSGLSSVKIIEGSIEIEEEKEASFKFKSDKFLPTAKINRNEDSEQSSKPDGGHGKLSSCHDNVGKRKVLCSDMCSTDGDNNESLIFQWESENSLNISDENSSLSGQVCCQDISDKEEVDGNNLLFNNSSVFEGIIGTKHSGKVNQLSGGRLCKKLNKNPKLKGKVKMASGQDTNQSLFKWLHNGDKTSDLKLSTKGKRSSSGLWEGTSHSSDSQGEDDMMVSLEDVDQSQMTQEQSDYLIALRLQKMYEKLDKSNIRVDRFKGSKDQYSLRKKQKLTPKAESSLKF